VAKYIYQTIASDKDVCLQLSFTGVYRDLRLHCKRMNIASDRLYENYKLIITFKNPRVGIAIRGCPGLFLRSGATIIVTGIW